MNTAPGGPVDRPDTATFPQVDTWLVRAHGLAALGTLLVSVVFGIIISLQFFHPDLVGGWGRLRFAHTQGIMLGWLGNAFLSFMYHGVPVLTGRAVTSPVLGRWLFGLWNFAVVIPGWLLVLAGSSQSIEWAEFPLAIDAFVMLGLGLAAIQFLPPFFRTGLDDLYVSSWYIIGSLVFTFLAYPMGNTVPELVPGAESAAFSGLWIHDAVGLFVTPLALAIIYFVIPAVTGRPVFSHFLSMLGFWGLFFFYPLNGTHHYVFSVIPMAAQVGAITASAILGIIVIIVVTNLLLSLRGAGFIPRDIGLRFIATSVLFYLIVSVQGALQAQMQFNQAIHFTDWVIGHSHLAMLGFATFAGIGGIIHAWQRIPAACYNATALTWSYWLLVTGIGIMVIDLTLAGLVQAELWQTGAPWLESVRASRPYWMVRTLSAVPISAGFIALLSGLCSGPQGAGAKVVSGKPAGQSPTTAEDGVNHPGTPAVAAGARGSKALRMSYLVASVAGIGFFAGSVVLLGVLPGRALDAQISGMSPTNVLAPDAAVSRGRAVYIREGCAYCHTQQIRYTDADIRRFGAPTLAWEAQFDYPHQWGTRRIGPDLARAGGTRTREWQLVHLFTPRTVVPLSVMPAYTSLFDGAPDRPRQEALDLVSYLESLGQARALAWPDADITVADKYADDRWVQMSVRAPVLNAHPGMVHPRGEFPVLPGASPPDRGRALWTALCAGCHGEDGRGDGPAADWLEPRPADLTLHEYSPDGVTDVLWNGIAGTSMPAWRDQALGDLAALVDVVRGFAAVPTAAQTSTEQLALGAQVYLENCVQCHGAAGAGDGFAAAELPIRPTNFRQVRPAEEASLGALTRGVAGTPMAPWGDRLNGEEMLAVTRYLRQLFVPGDTSPGVVP